MRNALYLAGIVAFVGAASFLAFDVSHAGTRLFYVLLAAPTVALAIVGVVRARNDGILKDWIAVRSGDFTRGFAAAAILFGLSFACMKAVMPPSSDRSSWLARLYLQIGDPAVLRKEVGLVVAGLVVIAVAEELVWRGLVMGLLEEMMGSRRAWVWQAVLYALAHAPTAWALRDPVAGANPVVIVAALGCVLVWGGMARRFERLLPVVISHVLFDWVVVMMFRLWGPSV